MKLNNISHILIENQKKEKMYIAYVVMLEKKNTLAY